MSWHWTPALTTGADDIAGGGHGSDDLVRELSDQQFPTQGEAESWLGENYPQLSAAGVAWVSLHEEDRLVYGPMSLEPPG